LTPKFEVKHVRAGFASLLTFGKTYLFFFYVLSKTLFKVYLYNLKKKDISWFGAPNFKRNMNISWLEVLEVGEDLGVMEEL
jgi:hypothetical protein